MKQFYFSASQADIVEYLQECLGATIVVGPYPTGLGVSVTALTLTAAVFTTIAWEPRW